MGHKIYDTALWKKESIGNKEEIWLEMLIKAVELVIIVKIIVKIVVVSSLPVYQFSVKQLLLWKALTPEIMKNKQSQQNADQNMTL